MRRALAAAVITALGLLVQACSSGTPAPSDPTTQAATESGTSSSTVPSTTTTTTTPTGPTEPVMPALAKEKSTAGAKAFVAYSIDVLNYSQTHSSWQPLMAISSTSCEACDGLIWAIKRIHARGGFQHGGNWYPREMLLVPNTPAKSPLIVTSVRSSPGVTKLSRIDELHHYPADMGQYEFSIVWKGNRWRLDGLRPT